MDEGQRRPSNSLGAAWWQGSLIDPPIVRSLNDAESLSSAWIDSDVAIVVSHSCDLRADDESEPTVEIIRGRPLVTLDGALTFGKNPRRYHLDASTEAGTRLRLELLSKDRFNLRKGLLLGAQPVDRLDASSVRRIVLWIARKYSRAAFPDSFNERFRPERERTRKMLKTGGDDVSGIYLLLSTMDEIPQSETYRVGIIFTMEDSSFSRQDLRTSCQELCDKFAAAMGSCDGIEVEESDLVSEADFSYDDLRTYLRWDVDDLSERSPSASGPADSV